MGIAIVSLALKIVSPLSRGNFCCCQTLSAMVPQIVPQSGLTPDTIKIFGLHINSSKICLCSLCNALHAHYIFLFPEHFLM